MKENNQPEPEGWRKNIHKTLTFLNSHFNGIPPAIINAIDAAYLQGLGDRERLMETFADVGAQSIDDLAAAAKQAGIQEAVEAFRIELTKAQEEIHGGGNGRRLLTDLQSKIDKLTKKE